MKKHFYLLFLTCFCLHTFGQISDFKEKFDLPNEVKETSGLIFYNNKIITHTDSGGAANLYEIDSLSGNITRTISLTNATNVDWEDITQDDTHIYIADMGNNNGNRTDLKIYKILKEDYKNNTSVSAEIISFSYEDQTDFSNSTTHNFDAEALTIYNDNLFIFTKNRGDYKTNAYIIPKTQGTHSATKVSTFNSEGLITGAVYNPEDNSFMLCGYDNQANPFLVYVGHNRNTGNDIFNNDAQKIDITQQVGQGSQIEGITFFNHGKYYLSREEVNVSGFNFPPKLYEFTNDSYSLLSIKNTVFSNEITVYPSATNGKLFIESPQLETLNNIAVFNHLGKKLLELKTPQNTIDLTALPIGVYYLKIDFKSAKTAVKKVIKL